MGGVARLFIWSLVSSQDPAVPWSTCQVGDKKLPHVQKLTKRTRLGILVSSCVRASIYVEWHQLSILLVSRVQRVERGGGGESCRFFTASVDFRVSLLF